MSQEKTLPPTPHRLRKARREGDAPQTKDFVTTAVTLVGFGVLLALLGVFGGQLIGLIQRAIAAGVGDDFRTAGAGALSDGAWIFSALVAPFLASALLIAPLAAMLAQGGFTLAKYKLKFDALSPAKNLAQRFSLQNLLEFIKTMIRFSLVLFVFGAVVWEALPILLLTGFCGLDCAGAVARDVGLVFLGLSFALMLVIALADIGLQRMLWRRRLRMSHDEVKRELKDTEGDPDVKRARKAQARRALATTPEEAIAYASAVFIDAAGRAAALNVATDEDPPRVVVLIAGGGPLARDLIGRARRDGVVVIEADDVVAATIGLSGMQRVDDRKAVERIAAAMAARGAAL